MSKIIHETDRNYVLLENQIIRDVILLIFNITFTQIDY